MNTAVFSTMWQTLNCNESVTSGGLSALGISHLIFSWLHTASQWLSHFPRTYFIYAHSLRLNTGLVPSMLHWFDYALRPRSEQTELLSHKRLPKCHCLCAVPFDWSCIQAVSFITESGPTTDALILWRGLSQPKVKLSNGYQWTC